jgi:EAL domain-containing protein (putative c-di-GMP-specific phosphodiesterase class I)
MTEPPETPTTAPELPLPARTPEQQAKADRAARLAKALRDNDVNPSLLTCEITETVAMEDTETTIRVFHQLARLGVSISIDDFGTGHSSLSYLRKLPASELKIDRSFVLDLETSEDARKVASAFINLAKSLDLKVVAEGVETEEQLAYVASRGCDYVQGYLTGKPMPAHVAMAALKENLYAELLPDELRAGIL